MPTVRASYHLVLTVPPEVPVEEVQRTLSKAIGKTLRGRGWAVELPTRVPYGREVGVRISKNLLRDRGAQGLRVRTEEWDEPFSHQRA